MLLTTGGGGVTSAGFLAAPNRVPGLLAWLVVPVLVFGVVPFGVFASFWSPFAPFMVSSMARFWT